MVESVQVYLDYLRSHIKPDDEVDVEFRFDLTHVADGMFGTGDCVIYQPEKRHLIVADFKYGRGVAVDPDDNPQLLSYGLGAIKRHGNRPLATVSLVVVQPRCRHPAGPVREWGTDVFGLFEFEEKLRAAALDELGADARRRSQHQNAQSERPHIGMVLATRHAHSLTKKGESLHNLAARHSHAPSKHKRFPSRWSTAHQ